jgi:hypothetical protein
MKASVLRRKEPDHDTSDTGGDNEEAIVQLSRDGKSRDQRDGRNTEGDGSEQHLEPQMGRAPVDAPTREIKTVIDVEV